ncbi:MAG: hypothetical protein A2017_22130 [Lentisphaerae bacterium GWF2_44_16]|nr:MAG: hypothetical protein A2017_22130 [Lentisphaerae bacterium GWF2_44_16]
MKKWHDLGPFTIFDLETTGMSPVRDRIVEIAAIRIELDGSQSRYHSLVNPKTVMPEKVIQIHGITNEMVADAPVFRTAGREFSEFAAGSTLVAHNARFDLGFLQESLFREGYEIWKGKTMDSIPIIKQAYSGLPSYSLQYLRRRFGLGDELSGPAHRAFADVEWTLEVFQMSLKTLLEKTDN